MSLRKEADRFILIEKSWIYNTHLSGTKINNFLAVAFDNSVQIMLCLGGITNINPRQAYSASHNRVHPIRLETTRGDVNEVVRM